MKPGLGGLAIGVSLALGLAAPADAARWPTTTVTYRNYTKAPRTIREAVRQWNFATAPVRIVPARRGQRPDIRILPRFSDSVGGLLRHPSAAPPPDGRVWLGPNYRDGAELDRFFVSIVAHELGHALGLRHVRDPCSVMSPENPLTGGGWYRDKPWPLCKAPTPPSGRYRCGPQLRDARALAQLYRTKVERRRHLGTCAEPPDPPPPPPLGTLVAPLEEVAVERNELVHVQVRNESRATWTGAVSLQFVSANGDAAPYWNCRLGEFDEALQANDDARPGTIATFSFWPCSSGDGQPVRTVFLQLVSGTRSMTRRGPVFRIDLRWPSGPAPTAEPERIGDHAGESTP